MAQVKTILSFTTQDADGEIAAMPIYCTMDDTQTLGDIAVLVAAIGILVDTVMDGKVIKQFMKFEVNVGAVKSDPVAGSEIETTGLISFPLEGLTQKSYSLDIPAFARSLFVGNKINLANVDVGALIEVMTGVSPFPPPIVTNDTWSYNLLTPTKGRKTFRKHRRQTERT